MKTEPILLKQGEHYQLTLPGYSTSGYEWIIKNTDEKIISVSKTFKKETATDRRVGKSPEEVFQLTGLSKGSFQLTLELKRSWENSFKEKRNYHVFVE